MEFHFGGKGHVLRGLRGQKVRIIQGKELPKAMTNASHLCMLQLIPEEQEDKQKEKVARQNRALEMEVQKFEHMIYRHR